jgi:quercetin dioxygenase-like cupin family protein
MKTMRTYSIRRALLFVVLGTVFAGSLLAPAAAQAPTVTRRVLLQQDLTIPNHEAALVSVELPAGGREGRHTHSGTLVVYILEGTMTLDYEGKPTASYGPGQSFAVEPGKVHEGINKGNVPVKALATFVVPKGQPMTTQVK